MNRYSFQLSLHGLRSRRWIATVLVPLLLFAQFATAAYLCPQLVPAVLPSASMPANCDQMNADPDQPNLCKAHCQANGQASGTTLDLASAMLASGSHMAWRLPARTTIATRVETSNAPPRGGPPLYLLHMALRN